MMKLLFVSTMLCAAQSVIQASTVVPLQPVPDAFARLGYSCGGIRQQIIATGFDAICILLATCT